MNETDEVADSDYEAIEREKVADVFLNGEYDRLYNQTSEAFQAEVTAEQLQEIGEEFNDGVENYVLQSELTLDDNVSQFTWADEAGTKGIVTVFSENDTIEGFQEIGRAHV